MSGLDPSDSYSLGLLGSPEQESGVERYVRDDIRGKGSPLMVVRNPAGISLEILLDRGLDIGYAFTEGISLAWKSPTGYLSSDRFDDSDFGWTKTFPGGLLSTLGLESTGMPSSDGGREFGLHGRIGSLPADSVDWSRKTPSEIAESLSADQIPRRAIEYARSMGEVICISGAVTESRLGCPTLRMERQIIISTERPCLLIVDTVTNIGWQPAEHMFRYHFNFGYPLVRPGTRIRTSSASFGSRGDSEPELPMSFNLAVADAEGGRESVHYFRSVGAIEDSISIHGANDVTLCLTYGAENLPYMVLWRDDTRGTNILGVEPSTSLDEGRASARQKGDLVHLGPQESRVYWTHLRLRKES